MNTIYSFTFSDCENPENNVHITLKESGLDKWEAKRTLIVRLTDRSVSYSLSPKSIDYRSTAEKIAAKLKGLEELAELVAKATD